MSLAPLTLALVAQARATRQRRVLVLAGERAWAGASAAAALQAVGLTDVLWITNHAPANARVLHGAHARQVLGTEVDAVVFDFHAGIDVEAFGAVVGAIRAGGLLVVLAPSSAEWGRFEDPEQARITVHPVAPGAVSRRFQRRLLRELRHAGGLVWVEQHEAVPTLGTKPATPVASLTPDVLGCLTADQRVAVEAVLALAREPDPAPLVLTSDRGRGKSAALGLAAAALLEAGTQRIVVTAPRFDAAAVLFAHAQARLPAARRSRDVVRYRDARLQFVPPDGLHSLTDAPDLLLVDEAAAVPVALLERMLDLGARIVFATTVHGYEGSGRGFATRFQAVLNRRRPGWCALRMTQPVRWAEDDPLERLAFRALLLDGAPAADELTQRASATECRFEVVERDRLADDEALLSQLFGLLVLAHYRTSPLDLRFLLDGPNLRVWLARFEGEVIAAALVAAEGGFDAALAHAIWEGARRPRGHLLAQSLAVHGGLEEAPMRHFQRIVRIAVHPAAQGRGIGRALVAQVVAAAESDGADAVGSSFGAAPELVRFWARNGLHPVRLGLTRETAGGAPAVMVLRPLSAAGEALYAAARTRYLDALPHLLRDPLGDLDPTLAALLALRQSDDPPPLAQLDARDRRELALYAAGRRDLELVIGPLQRLLDDPSLAALPPPARELIGAKLRERMPWPVLVHRFGFQGKGAATAAVRAALRDLIA